MAGNNKENVRPTIGNNKTFQHRKKSSGAGYDTNNTPKLRREMKFHMHDASQKKQVNPLEGLRKTSFLKSI